MLLKREYKKCKNCGLENGFISFSFEFGGYGYMAGRNEAGTKFCILELTGNEEFAEFCKLYEEECGDGDITKMRHMFAIACDPVDGGRVFFEQKPEICSGCGGNDFYPLLRDEPAADADYFDVSYAIWNSLDTGAKRSLIKEAYNESIR